MRAIRCVAGKIVAMGCAVHLAALLSPCATAQTRHAPASFAQATALSSRQTAALSLPDQIAGILAAPAVARDHWGIDVTGLDGAPIYSLNEAQLFHPASNAKLFTTAAALALLGADKRFETQVIAAREIDKRGILHGDLRLTGGGDPSFGTQDLPYLPPTQRPKTAPPAPTVIADIEELADKVYASGLRRIEGDVVGDDGKFTWAPYPPGWQLDDLVYGYAAPVSALSVHDNEVELTISHGEREGDHIPAKTVIQIDPDVPYYTVENAIFSSGEKYDCSNIGFQREPSSRQLLVYANVQNQPKQSSCRQAIAIADPAEYAAILLKAALERRGVTISGTARAKHHIWNYPNPATRVDPFVASAMQQYALTRPYAATVPDSTCDAQSTGGDPQSEPTLLASHQSQPLSADVTYTLKVSQNLHAEIILRDLGAAYGCEHTPSSGLTVLRAFFPLLGIAPGDFSLVDGSGLSEKDLVTPRAVAKLLSYAARDPKTGQPQPWFAGWKSSLPIGGEDGSLESRFMQPPLKDHVFAKTGTLGESRALSGYLDCASGRAVIFSILVDNHLPGTADDRDAMDKIVAAIQAAE